LGSGVSVRLVLGLSVGVRVMGVERGGLGSWIFKITAKKGCYLSLQGEKTNFTTFSPPTKILENSLVALRWQNPSNTHG